MKFAFIRNPLAFFLSGISFAWAIGFARYFDHWVFFPAFPNIFDSLGLSMVGAYLLYKALGKSRLLADKLDAELKPILSVFNDIDPEEE